MMVSFMITRRYLLRYFGTATWLLQNNRARPHRKTMARRAALQCMVVGFRCCHNKNIKLPRTCSSFSVTSEAMDESSSETDGQRGGERGDCMNCL
mmetsp:Transcript_5387/g.10706  ORF Transcript_5387/g.10706 Transcript_5387/m.10706 type:complete len:95 (+) Transcript_5387:1267-1551(+)